MAIQHNWITHVARSNEECKSIIAAESLDLVVVERDKDAQACYTLCSAIRREYSHDELPILFILDNQTSSQVSRIYEHGANDYIAKPFTLCELLSRIQTQLKIRLLQRYIAQSILTKTEKEILCLYSQHRGEKRREIIKLLNKQKPHPITLKTLDNHITNILKKIDATHIADAAIIAKKQRWI